MPSGKASAFSKLHWRVAQNKFDKNSINNIILKSAYYYYYYYYYYY
jgi:hypothetical protein